MVFGVDTTSWYDDNAEGFAERTRDLDVGRLYERFMEHVTPNGTILDAGCGSGRDSKAFLERGFDVTAIDASSSMAALAARHIGRPVAQMRFQDIAWEDEFDGIWTCASLLHVPKNELPPVFSKLARALKPGGVLYASFKLGRRERKDAVTGRHFTDLTEDELRELAESPALRVLTLWVNDDDRPEYNTKWLNMLVQKRS